VLTNLTGSQEEEEREEERKGEKESIREEE
jgi:hypothetical protein